MGVKVNPLGVEKAIAKERALPAEQGVFDPLIGPEVNKGVALVAGNSLCPGCPRPARSARRRKGRKSK